MTSNGIIGSVTANQQFAINGCASAPTKASRLCIERWHVWSVVVLQCAPRDNFLHTRAVIVPCDRLVLFCWKIKGYIKNFHLCEVCRIAWRTRGLNKNLILFVLLHPFKFRSENSLRKRTHILLSCRAPALVSLLLFHVFFIFYLRTASMFELDLVPCFPRPVSFTTLLYTHRRHGSSLILQIWHFWPDMRIQREYFLEASTALLSLCHKWLWFSCLHGNRTFSKAMDSSLLKRGRWVDCPSFDEDVSGAAVWAECGTSRLYTMQMPRKVRSSVRFLMYCIPRTFLM